MIPITQEHIALAADFGHRFDIGLNKVEKKILERRVKRGHAVRVKAPWPFLTWGTCLKTCYINTQTIFAHEA